MNFWWGNKYISLVTIDSENSYHFCIFISFTGQRFLPKNEVILDKMDGILLMTFRPNFQTLLAADLIPLPTDLAPFVNFVPFKDEQFLWKLIKEIVISALQVLCWSLMMRRPFRLGPFCSRTNLRLQPLSPGEHWQQKTQLRLQVTGSH